MSQSLGRAAELAGGGFEIRGAHGINRAVRTELFMTPIRLLRRRAVLTGGVAAVAGAGALALSVRPRANDIAFLKGIDLSRVRSVGDGFYEADGWILTADDLRRLGGAAAPEIAE